jgi:hypothetical protein
LPCIYLFFQSTTDGEARKGLKLNFQTLEAVEPSLELVKSLCSDLPIPFFLHANVLAAEATLQADNVTAAQAAKAAEGTVDADTFISLAKTLLPGYVEKTRFTLKV